ncbi:hypothetical protein [Tautonia plasticadhaerens]|uniref:Uncharacterized protein n=1 Tax=Tautonia plasticadhaerens TaxID=2527974 RepID=A0A518HCX9_9BACT|nr:hypothetical protein [Tautonia plasticadhaerens]QDV38719.1 hypothetical protein ElP_66750 [Tautonia plasticadhaerens]
MHIFDTSPLRDSGRHRRRLPSRPSAEVDLDPGSVALGMLSIAISLATLALLALPPLGLAESAPRAFDTSRVPVMTGSSTLEEVFLPSPMLMIAPAAGAFLAILGAGPRRRRGVPIVPIIGVVCSAVTLVAWWAYPLWFLSTYGHLDIGLP